MKYWSPFSACFLLHLSSPSLFPLWSRLKERSWRQRVNSVILAPLKRKLILESAMPVKLLGICVLVCWSDTTSGSPFNNYSLIVRLFWHCCRLPFLGSVMTKEWVHGVGHSPVCQILLQVVVKTVITSSPPAWTSSAGMLSTSADFPFFNDFTLRGRWKKMAYCWSGFIHPQHQTGRAYMLLHQCCVGRASWTGHIRGLTR